jgi:hypothetical protein
MLIFVSRREAFLTETAARAGQQPGDATPVTQ